MYVLCAVCTLRNTVLFWLLVLLAGVAMAHAHAAMLP